VTFTPEQTQALTAPLDPKHVAQREQAGQKLSYIEGWHVIAEANRIFGFDAWTRETVELRCVAERERLVGRQQKPGWGVTYIARVRISVGDVIRDGCGTGHGIGTDLGECHESALKEAETDAMKRALMTFGNPFGLALYDKSHANVQAVRPPVITDDQRDELMDMMTAYGVSPQDFCHMAKIKSLKELQAARFAGAKGWIQDQRKAAA